MLFLNVFEVNSGQNNPKNSVKIRLFKGRIKKSCLVLAHGPPGPARAVFVLAV